MTETSKPFILPLNDIESQKQCQVEGCIKKASHGLSYPSQKDWTIVKRLCSGHAKSYGSFGFSTTFEGSRQLWLSK